MEIRVDQHVRAAGASTQFYEADNEPGPAPLARLKVRANGTALFRVPSPLMAEIHKICPTHVIDIIL